jgi:hypothetical protein
MSWLVLLFIPAAAVAAFPGVSRSRRILAGALVLLVPVAGPVLALLVRRARGGAIAMEPARAEAPRRMCPGDVRRLGELPPVLDRLLGNDATERLAALVALSSAGDAHAIAVLRWTIEHGPADVVLDAALTLDEIELRSGPLAAPHLEEASRRPALPRRNNTGVIQVRDVAAAALLG